MSTVASNRTFTFSLADGRPLVPGGELTDVDLTHPENASLLQEGVIVELDEQRDDNESTAPARRPHTKKEATS